MVVGLVPVTCIRTFSCAPGAKVPGITTVLPSVTPEAEPWKATSDTATVPLFRHQIDVRYSLFEPAVLRPIVYRYVPPPVAALSAENCIRRSVLACDTSFRYAPA